MFKTCYSKYLHDLYHDIHGLNGSGIWYFYMDLTFVTHIVTHNVRDKSKWIPLKSTINDDNEDFEDRAYIAAKFLQQSIKYRFVLGDGLNYEGFINRKLKPDTFYKVFVRSYVDVPQKHLYTSSPFSPELNLNMMQEPSGPVPGRPKPGKFIENNLHSSC